MSPAASTFSSAKTTDWRGSSLGRLDGTPSPAAARVQTFIDALRARTALSIVTEDERLTSREAESRLALRERDWRKRKAQLDAIAAAIFLQDYLDTRQV